MKKGKTEKGFEKYSSGHRGSKSAGGIQPPKEQRFVE